MRRLLLAATLLSLGCQDEPPQASSRLQRPSGLAYVTRSAARADIFIADSEARGVRVLQLAKLQTTDGRLIDDQLFLAGPAIFFPLVIPAFDFPTALSPTDDGHRLYVLSPVGPSMHVLDVREAPYGQSAAFVEGYEPLAEFDLDALRGVLGMLDLIGPDAIAVDLDVLPGSGSEDRVAITFDRVLSDSSLVVVFGVSSTDFSLSLVSTATVAPGPRGTSVRRAMPSGLVISSVASSSISFLPFAETATAGAFGQHRALFAGGPTSNVVDAADAGVLALRLDRASAVLFEASAGRLERSSRSFRSPYTPELELGTTDARGRIDTFPRALSAGAHGVVSSLASSVTFPTGTATDAVALVHVDGTMSFLVGRPLSLSLAGVTTVDRVTRVRADGLDLEGCAEQDDQAGDPFCPVDLPAACEATVLANDLTRLSGLHVEFEGALAQRDGGQLLASTSTRARAMTLRDSQLSSFGTRAVEPGHHVLLQYRGAPSCGSEAIVEWVETATVVALSPTEPELTVQFGAASDFIGAVPCDGGLHLTRYQIYPAGRVVVSELLSDESTPRIVGVFDVSPADLGGQKVVLDRGPLLATVTAPSGFSCLEGPAASGPARCESNADCGGGQCRTAEVAPGAGGEVARACGRFCSHCSDADPDCFQGFVARSCSGLDLSVDPARLTATNPRTLVADPVTTIPQDIVFSPIRESWIYSLPGARSLAEVRTLLSEDGELVFGGTPEIRASTEAR